MADSKQVVQLKLMFAENMIKQLHSEPSKCKYCKSPKIIKFGRSGHGSSRYRCHNCLKTFVNNVGMANDNTRKDHYIWNLFIDCMLSQLSVRKAAEVCGIDKNTAFKWRHQLFDTLESLYPGHIDDNLNNEDLFDTNYLSDPDSLDNKSYLYDGFDDNHFPLEKNEKYSSKVNIEGWQGIEIKNANRYRKWNWFVKEAIKSGFEQKYIKDHILK